MPHSQLDILPNVLTWSGGLDDVVRTRLDCQMDRLSHSGCLAQILIEAGSWVQCLLPDEQERSHSPKWSCLDVCVEWRDCMLDHPIYMADLLRGVHGPEEALVRAAGCHSTRMDKTTLMKELLKTARADCLNGQAVISPTRRPPKISLGKPYRNTISLG